MGTDRYLADELEIPKFSAAADGATVSLRPECRRDEASGAIDMPAGFDGHEAILHAAAPSRYRAPALIRRFAPPSPTLRAGEGEEMAKSSSILAPMGFRQDDGMGRDHHLRVTFQ
jgi:hypothetical protein